MRKAVETVPTIALMGLLIFSMYQRSLNDSWINLFALSLAGLCVYSPVALFIEGIVTKMKKSQNLPTSEKIFIWYLAIISIIFIGLTVYLMGTR
ncbi:hypothetical protein EGT49_05975 [Companilactobacillus suantsaicola]|uniref:Uncharacterized protein n=1 Tax=Companilactobacillus suantsaicola TaxID=2487723 RepID=A0A4Z0JMP3_9LACO|nr:LasU family protein [Companilactobacillus suantsaicola]TGD23416.1 hypothetical protein EGT49_05975 [Companilactobacillus suantsaicola]